MEKEKIKDVDKAYRDSHSKGIIYTDNTKYEQHKRKKIERRKVINQSSKQNAEIGKQARQIAKLENLVNQLLEKESKE